MFATRRAARTVLASLLGGLLAAGLLSACTAEDDDAQPPPVSETTQPPLDLGELDTATLAVARAPFCEQVPESVVRRALGLDDDAPAPSVRMHDNGDEIDLPGGADRVHEYGCAWAPEGEGADEGTDDSAAGGGAAGGGAGASAWVFAPPVTPAMAERMAAVVAERRGCTVAGRAPEFGSVSAVTVCRGSSTTEVTYRGLFGDAWLVCTRATATDREADAQDLLADAGSWCGEVALAATPRSDEG